MQNKDIPKKLNYRYRYIGNKDIKAAREIPQLKKEIKKIETLYNRMNKSRNSIANINTNINIFNNYKELKDKNNKELNDKNNKEDNDNNNKEVNDNNNKELKDKNNKEKNLI